MTRSAPHLLLRTALISAPLGALLGFMFGGARISPATPRDLIHGALIALTAALLGTTLELVFHARLERLPRSLGLAVRAAMFTLAGFIGFVVGGGLARVLLWNRPFLMDGRMIYAVVISGLIAGALGLSFYTFERMRDNLRFNIEQLKESEFAAKELEIARSIQQRLLPPETLAGEGYRIAAKNLPARFVAGDFYDVFHLSDGSIGLVVADVAGKGVGASLIMASAKAVLPLIAEGRGVAATMETLNARFSQELTRREFVALAYARYHPGDGTIELANAGVPDPYLVRSGGHAEAVHVPGTRLPLGAMKSASYQSIRLKLEKGDRLLLFTDGLPEATALDGEPLGYERLPALLGQGESDTSLWLDGVFARLRANTDQLLGDDCTALVIERC
jgi:serine phosphatase RsbU (regulator of sigma subunit)